ncbi:MAG: hypothetical protein HQ580_13320 [Planctomycetes bacterium]|nr:hypothetical protein [Planctomycetota bacterium]
MTRKKDSVKRLKVSMDLKNAKLISDTIQKVPDEQKSVDLFGDNCKNMKTKN